MDYPKVAIVGRTNVGKSTLFNRLTETKQALISSLPGTTRDRNIQECFWAGHVFTLIDTGGLDVSYLPAKSISKSLLKKQPNLKDMEEQIIKQTQYAIRESDLVLFVVDASAGIQPEDRTIRNLLRKYQKPFLLLANKVDREEIRNKRHELLTLGAGTPFLISAATGVGCGDMLDAVLSHISNIPATLELKHDEIRVAIVGKPNVGKSSLLNKLCGSERVIVHELPHTTRESHDTVIEYHGKHLRLIDTAGIRRQAKIAGKLERTGIQKSIESIHRADVVLFLFEIHEPLTTQDRHILHDILKTKASVIFVANKWDLVPEKTVRTQKEYRKHIAAAFPFLSWAPILFLSAKTGQKVERVFDMILTVYDHRSLQINDEELKRFLQRLIKRKAPQKRKGVKHPKILGMEQSGIHPPRFTLLVDDTENVHPAYIRFIINQLYEQYSFEGTPIFMRLVA